MNRLNVKRLNRILSMLFTEMRVLDDEDRDLPIKWNMMHMYSSAQLAKVVAIKRGLNPELAGLIAALHDIGVVRTKRKKDHARKAKQYIEDIIDLYNTKVRNNLPIITDEERMIIVEAVINHSDKQVQSDDEYVELMKDVDSMDRFLHGIKTENEYQARCDVIFKELNIDNVDNE